MYTEEDFENFKRLDDEFYDAKEKFTKRACEVYLRLMTEYYLLHGDEDYTTWENLTMVAACKIMLGDKPKDYFKFSHVKAELLEDSVSLSAEYTSSGETDYLSGYIDNLEFLYNDQAITDWIKNKIEEDKEKFRIYQEEQDRKQQERLEELEQKERAEYERLKAKYENKENN